MDVLVTGSSGLIGSALVAGLGAAGHRVVRAVRPGSTAASGGDTITWDPAKGQIDAASLEGIDAIVNLNGAGIGDKRWTDDYKRLLVESRTLGTSLLARTAASLAAKPSVFLSGSAIGFYGARGDEVLTERSPAGSGFLPDLVRQWEASALPAVDAGIRTAFLRTGIVLTPNGGALAKQLPLFKFGLGGKFGSGRQWQSWIAIEDEVGAILHLLTADVRGPVNLTAPNPATNAQFTKELGKVLGRPTLLPIPKFGPSLLLGGELADSLLYTGQRVLPTVLQESGYRFQFESLERALRSQLGKG